MIKILFADDEEIVRNLYSQSLQGIDGFEVETASDGEEALEKIELFKPNLIILDIFMPKKNGYRGLKSNKIKSRYQKPSRANAFRSFRFENHNRMLRIRSHWIHTKRRRT